MVTVRNNREEERPSLVLVSGKGRVAVYDMTPSLKPSAPAFTLRLSPAPVAIATKTPGGGGAPLSPSSSSNAPGTAGAGRQQPASYNGGAGQKVLLFFLLLLLKGENVELQSAFHSSAHLFLIPPRRLVFEWRCAVSKTPQKAIHYLDGRERE